MTQFTVVWQHEAQDDLASAWLNADDRAAVTKAADAIDRELAEDAQSKGKELREGLRAIDVAPLRATYDIILDDRLVHVYRVRVIAM